MLLMKLKLKLKVYLREMKVKLFSVLTFFLNISLFKCRILTKLWYVLLKDNILQLLYFMILTTEQFCSYFLLRNPR